ELAGHDLIDRRTELRCWSRILVILIVGLGVLREGLRTRESDRHAGSVVARAMRTLVDTEARKEADLALDGLERLEQSPIHLVIEAGRFGVEFVHRDAAPGPNAKQSANRLVLLRLCQARVQDLERRKPHDHRGSGAAQESTTTQAVKARPESIQT